MTGSMKGHKSGHKTGPMAAYITGLVKELRAEPANATLLAGGTLTLELTEWP